MIKSGKVWENEKKKIRGSSYYTSLQGESKTNRALKNASEVALWEQKSGVGGISVNKEAVGGSLKTLCQEQGRIQIYALITWRNRVGREVGGRLRMDGTPAY